MVVTTGYAPQTSLSAALRQDARAGVRRPMVDASKCTASGAGIGGGTACAPAKFTVTTADASGERVREGGAKLVVTVTPASVKPSSNDAETPGVVVHEPVDHGDGTYACSYVVPRRGDYSVGVVVDHRPIAGSPFPVFFAGANPGAEPFAHAGETPGVTPTPTPTTTPIPTPTDAATSVIVKNLAAGIGVEHLRATFSVCGAVLDARVAGSGGQFAFVEFATHAEATKALRLSGMALGDRTIKVEMARTPKRIASTGAGVAVAPPPTFQGKPLPPPPTRREGVARVEAPQNQNASAAAVAAERAAKISEKLKRDGDSGDVSEARGRSPHPSRSRSRSRSRD